MESGWRGTTETEREFLSVIFFFSKIREITVKLMDMI